MTKIKVTFKTGEVIRFLGCDIQIVKDMLQISCGDYKFTYHFSEIKYFYVKGRINEKEVEA